MDNNFEKIVKYGYIKDVLEVFFLTRTSDIFLHRLHSIYYDEREYSDRFHERSSRLWDSINSLWEFHFNEDINYEGSGFLKDEFWLLNEIFDHFKTREPVLLEYIHGDTKNSDFFHILLEESLISCDKGNLYLSDSFINMMEEVRKKYAQAI